MRTSTVAMILGVSVAGASTSHADVVVHLRSGGTIRADRSWSEGDTVKVQMGNDVASFSSAAIESIEPVPGGEHPADPTAPKAAAAKKPIPPPESNAKAAPAKPAPAVQKKDLVPAVQGEDTATKLERLDALLLQTHRELSIARRQGEPEEKLKEREDKIDEVNRQRVEAMRKLGMRP